MSELCDLVAVELRRLIGAKEISPRELLASCRARVEAVDPAVNAMVATCWERAEKEAAAAEKAVLDGEELAPLHGLPIGVKDLNMTEGVRTTQGSLLHKDDVPEEDERMVAAIRSAGGIVVGKTNTPEFGAGANTKNRVYGATGNPFDPSLTCGGSSGGAAVSLATGMVPLSTGSDFGGSLRTPAGFCGIVGYRPTPGIVADEKRGVGLSPLPVQGPMARTVADTALLLSVQAAEDRRDPYARPIDGAALRALQPVDLSSLKVAVSEDLGCAPLDDEIRKVFRARVGALRSVFGSCEDRDPDLGDVHEVFEILRGVNFIAGHGERVANHRDLLGPNVIDNTERAMKYTAADVAWAHVEQTAIYRRMLEFFEDVDVLICPACAVSPFPHEELTVTEVNGKPMDTYMRWLAMTYGLTMTTHPAAVLPCGRDHKGLPFGIQLVGRFGEDEALLRIAGALELYMAGQPELARPLPDLERLAKHPVGT